MSTPMATTRREVAPGTYRTLIYRTPGMTPDKMADSR
jgi:hypothetical protein